MQVVSGNVPVKIFANRIRELFLNRHSGMKLGFIFAK